MLDTTQDHKGLFEVFKRVSYPDDLLSNPILSGDDNDYNIGNVTYELRPGRGLCSTWSRLLRRDKKRGKENTYHDMSVGVTSVRDEKVKLRDLHSSDALGCVGDWNT